MMTDQDNSPKGFLDRWSRKKIESEREAPVAPAEAHATEVSLPNEPGLPAPRTEDGAKVPAQVAKATPKPEFDLASLPPLDSITAVTDIRAFLGPGVPKELAR